MKQKYYTQEQAIAHCDVTVMKAKAELVQEIATEKSFIKFNF
jgi:hypothetical protein